MISQLITNAFRQRLFLIAVGGFLLLTLNACGSGAATATADSTNSPVITITDSAPPNDDWQVPFGSVSIGSDSEKTVTIKNDGTDSLVIGALGSSHPLTLPFSLQNDNCSGQTLAPATSCTLTLRFAPSTAAVFNISFNIPSNDPDGASIIVGISGTGNADPVPNIVVTDSVSPDNDLQVPFGNVTVGAPSNRTVTIRNEGTGSLEIGALGSSDLLASPFSFLIDNCSGQALAPATSCILTFQFEPNTTGISNDSFDIPSNDPDEASVIVGVSGTGDPVPVPDIVVTDSVAPSNDRLVPFGLVTIGEPLERTVTVTNVGAADLVLGTMASPNSLALPFSLQVDNCSGQTLAPATSCTLTLRFAPSAAVVSNDSFEIPSNDPDEASVVVNVSGTGDFAPFVAIVVTDSAPPTNDLRVPFGNVTVGATLDRTVTVTNEGTANLMLGTMASPNSLASPFSLLIDNCSGRSLAPAANCTLTLQFAPSAAVVSNDSFNIPSNDPDEASITVDVSGTGDPIPVPDIDVTDSVAPNDDQQVPFGTVMVGAFLDRTVTVTNVGTADLMLGTVASPNLLLPPFGLLIDNCSGQTLAPAADCTLTLRFAPSGVGVSNDSFNIPTINDPDEASVTVNLSGMGAPVPAPSISVLPTSLSFPAVLCGSSFSKSVTVQNVGTADLNNISTAMAGSTTFSRINACPSSLAPDASCEISVKFTPTGLSGQNGTLTINSNDSGGPVDVSLTGFGSDCDGGEHPN